MVLRTFCARREERAGRPVTYACLDVLQLSKVLGILIRQSVVADLAEMTKA